MSELNHDEVIEFWGRMGRDMIMIIDFEWNGVKYVVKDQELIDSMVAQLPDGTLLLTERTTDTLPLEIRVVGELSADDPRTANAAEAWEKVIVEE